MTVLLTIGPEPGNINAGIALAKLLDAQGIATHLLTSPSAQRHVEQIRAATQGVLRSVTYSPSHELDFDRRSPNRKPHAQQLCDQEKIIACVRRELDLARELTAKLIINKHYYSAAISANLAGIGYAMLYTDGPAYLRPGHNPQQTHINAECVEAVAAAYRTFDLAAPDAPPPYSLRSPTMNVVRGTPRSSGLDAPDADWLKAVCFAGNLTFSGGDEALIDELHDLNGPVAYLTFGTIANDSDRLRNVVERLARRGVSVICSYYNAELARDSTHPGRVVYARYLRSDRILPHVDIVVHHGGHGTYLEALGAGVPQIIVPDNASSSAQALHGLNAQLLGVGRLVGADAIDQQFDDAVTMALSEQTRERAASEGQRFRSESEHLQRALSDSVVGALALADRQR